MSLGKRAASLLLGLTIAFTGFFGRSVFLASADSRGGVTGYVERLYITVLQRQPDQAGIDSWVAAMSTGTSAAECAAGFFGSDEFRNRELSNDEYLTILYDAMLGREADEGGLAAWSALLEDGYPRNQVLADFVGSDEFTAICNSFGVTRGDYAVTDVLDVNYRAAEFVRRAYRLILGREADPDGLRDWTERIANGSITATGLVQGFFGSQEFLSRNVSNEEFVSILYNTMLSRDGDPPGIQTWLSLLDAKGVSRNYILKGFADSAEFCALCDNYGLPKGTVELDEPRDWNPDRNVFIINAYMSAYERMPEAGELNDWARAFTGGTAAKVLLNAIFDSISLPSMTPSDAITQIYETCLGRRPSDAELRSGRAFIATNGIPAFIDSIYGSEEFASFCEGYGVGSIYNVGLNVLDGKIYYYDGTSMRTGWQTIEGRRYFFDPERYSAVIGWRFIDGLKYYFNEDGTLCQDVDPIIGMQSSYYVTVNIQTNTIMIYAQSETGNYDIPVRAMICSCGVGGSTVTGDFTIERLGRWRELMGPCWGQYCSRITGNYLFHSSWYYRDGDPRSLSVTQFNQLGRNASHGCVRLTVLDAKWIWEHCNGSRVHVFSSPEGIPFDRPVPYPAVAISGDYGYDPRDPLITG